METTIKSTIIHTIDRLLSLDFLNVVSLNTRSKLYELWAPIGK